MGMIYRLKNKPKDCLHCECREVIHTVDRAYQKCRCSRDGYKSESTFRAEDLKPGYVSPKCPLEREEDKIIEIIKEIYGQMNVDTSGRNVLNGGTEEYEKQYKAEIAENYGLKGAINIIKSYYPEIDINIEAVIRGEEKL